MTSRLNISQYISQKAVSEPIERCGRVINTTASYSRSPGFKSRTVIGYPDLGSLWFSSVPPDEGRDSTLD
jgi:hypothetical protein